MCTHGTFYNTNPREGWSRAKGKARQFVLRRESRRNPIFLSVPQIVSYHDFGKLFDRVRVSQVRKFRLHVFYIFIRDQRELDSRHKGSELIR